MKRGWLLLLLLASCNPDGPTDPEPTSMLVAITNPLELETPVRPRLAVIWALRDGDAITLHTTADIEAPSPNGMVDVPLEMPPESLLSKLTPRETLSLGSDLDASAAIYRPRLVVYDDGNQSEALELDPAAKDPVIAVDGDESGIAALLDVEAVLREIPIEEIGRLYRLTNGRFSPFLGVNDSGAGLRADPIVPIRIQLDDSGFPVDSLLCARPGIDVAGFESEYSIFLHTGVDPAICDTAIEPDSCTSMDLNAWPPPRLVTSSLSTHYRDVVCNRDGGPLEALIIAERTIECVDCACHNVYDTQVFVANLSSTPDWWPCGTEEAPICLKGSPIVTYSLICPD